MTNDRFSSNRNRFRRVYSFGGRPPPNIQTYTDNVTGEERTRDFNQILRDRDYYLINVRTTGTFVPPVPPIDVGEYEEKTIGFDGFNESTAITIFFDTPFSQIPYVSFEMSGSDTNCNGFISLVQTDKFIARFSDIVSPVNTFLTYRAVYAPSYPVIVERKPDHVGTYATCSAGIVAMDVVSGVTMSFAALSGAPEIFNSNIADPDGPDFTNYTLDVGHEVWTLTNSEATAELSVHYSGSMEFIALKTIPPGSPAPVNPDV